MKLALLRGHTSGLINGIELKPETSEECSALCQLQDEVDYSSASFEFNIITRLVLPVANKALPR